MGKKRTLKAIVLPPRPLSTLEFLEQRTSSLWASRTVWLSTFIGLCMLVQEFPDLVSPVWSQRAAAAAAVLTLLCRAQDKRSADATLANVQGAPAAEG